MIPSATFIRCLALLTVVVAAAAHDVPLQRRHGELNRILRKRAPDDITDLLGPVQEAADDTNTSSTTSASSLLPTGVSSGLSTTQSATSSGTSSTSTSSKSSSSTSSSSSSSTSSTRNTQPTGVQGSVVVINRPDVTLTVPGSGPKESTADNTTQRFDQTGATANNESKGTTMTIVIAVAASLAGVAVLWTVFRKWKLSSSKKFDRRLDPNWTPPASSPDDSPIPGHRRRTSNASSFRSAGTTNIEQDLTAGSTMNQVGGYADLARGSSPTMQEAHRGASFNRGYDQGVPLHHQQPGFKSGPYEAYDYEGRGVRY